MEVFFYCVLYPQCPFREVSLDTCIAIYSTRIGYYTCILYYCLLQHYALVDASENQVLMAVYHDPNNTHVYISEEAGMNYTLSLSNIISPPESEWIDSLVINNY